VVDFTLSPDYLARLIVKTRGVQARTAEVDADPGSNPIDDNAWDAVQRTRGDLTEEEVREEIQGLDERAQAELVALLWIGRGDLEPQEWNAAVALARSRRESPTPAYLLSQPLVAEYWSEGADRLGLALPMGERGVD
jgi:Protein of unknown function (DUF3775)